MNSGGVTGAAANAEFAGGGAANVVGGAAASGCVAVGNCTRCAVASCANTISKRGSEDSYERFNGPTAMGSVRKDRAAQRKAEVTGNG